MKSTGRYFARCDVHHKEMKLKPERYDEISKAEFIVARVMVS